MEKLLTLSIACGTNIRILQITDTHLFASKYDTLFGVNTFYSYNAVLNVVQAENDHCNLIVVTGDLAQESSPKAYQNFASSITQLPIPCVWLPGNHDFQPLMVNILAEYGISPAKQILIGKRWQLLLLDSQVYGVPYGELSHSQLKWLVKMLAQHPLRYTILMLHHHPVSSGCIWLDQHKLRNAHRLAEVLQQYPLVHVLLCGHIHQELDAYWQGRRVLASPSTCVQFKPHHTYFTIDTVSPGWRYLNLTLEGEVHTKVRRLTNNEY